MSDLPLDIIEDIMCLLPVKSLKRFRAVSKSWCSLIDSERFIKAHLHRSTVSCVNRRLLIQRVGFYSADLEPLGNFHSLRTPFPNHENGNITNSCNGLVLVTSAQPVLWNPFAKTYKILPDSSEKCPKTYLYHTKTEYGFGYDSRNDDYKVLKVTLCRDENKNVWDYRYTELFSLRLNSWKKVDDFPCLPLIWWGILRAHVCGSLHMLGELGHAVRTLYASKIMAFSVETETHYDLKFPPGFSTSGVYDLNLDVIEGCLCLISGNKSSTVLWVMKEYRNDESWNKLLSVRVPEMTVNLPLKPVAYSNDKEKVLLGGYNRNMVWYDLRNDRVAEVPIQGYFVTACVESLVSFDGPGEGRQV